MQTGTSHSVCNPNTVAAANVPLPIAIPRGTPKINIGKINE